MPADQPIDPSPSQLGDSMTITPGEWTVIDDAGTEIYLYDDHQPGQPTTIVVRSGDDPGALADRQCCARTLRDMADRIDNGPTFPLPPSVISALVRERADDLDPTTREETDRV